MSRLLRITFVFAFLIGLMPAVPASASPPADAGQPGDPPPGKLGGRLSEGETVIHVSADGKSRLVVTAGKPTLLRAPKGAAIMATIWFTTAQQTVALQHWCGPLSPSGYCEVWHYTLLTDFQYDGTYLYSDTDYQRSVAYSGYSMRDYIQTHYTLQSDPGTGWAMRNRSWGEVTIDRWAGQAVVDSCTIHLNNDINGNGSTAYSWYVAAGSCN